MPRLRNLRITSKFILWFLLISSIPLISATYISYNISRKILKSELANTLFVAADNKANQIESYLSRLKKDGVSLFSDPDTVNAIEEFSSAFSRADIDPVRLDAARQEFNPMFTYYQRLFGYEGILLVNPDGYVIFSTQTNSNPGASLYEIALSKRSELTDIFIKAKASQEIETSNFEYYPRKKYALVYIAIPIFKPSGMLSIAIIQLSSQNLYRFVRDYTGLGNTGETMLLSKIKDEAVFVTPLRFDKDAAFKRKIKLDTKEAADIQKCFEGKSGSGTVLDYRGHKVLSVWRYLPTLRLGMVVKMDMPEVFASADRLRDTLLKLNFIFLAIVVYVAVFIAHTVSRPIKELTRASKTISEGDLCARAAVEAEDEIGELAQSFNQMTDNLVEAKRNVEQKKTQLEEQKLLLEKANKELDSFVYTVSHDLRAPLRGIDGLADFLQQDYSAKLDEQGKDYLNKIRSSAIRMKALIDDLLKLSRISRIKNPYEEVDTAELLRSIQARLEFDIKKNNVQLQCVQQMPVMRCDRIKMEEAFFNLISNAIKFSSKNNPLSPKVEVDYQDREGTHQFCVKDNGIGIDKKHHAEIFGIFKRLHKESEYEGTGAGLSIVKKIIEDHGGSIWVDSQPGKGAAFYFTVPRELKTSIAEEEREVNGHG